MRRVGSRIVPALALLAFAAGAWFVSSRPFGAPRPPNVVIVLIDTLRADHTSLYGYPRDTTPFLRRLGGEGVLFEQARAQASCTFPSVNSILSGRHPSIFLGQPGGKLGFLASVPTLQEVLHDAGYRTLAISASTVVRKNPGPHNKIGGFDPGFDVFDEECMKRRAGCIAERSLAALPTDGTPFFLYAHFTDPHSPYSPAPAFERRFTQRGAAVRTWARRGDLGAVREFVRNGGPAVEPTPLEKEYLMGLYDEDILTVDDGIRRLVEGLEERGLARRTLMVVMADHGEEFFERGGVYHCTTTYDELVRTPLLLVAPGLGAGRVAVAVQNLDVMPTVLEALGIDSSKLGLEGRSLLDLARRAARSTPLAFSAQDVWRSVSDGRFKIVLNLKSGAAQLFDLTRDPGEKIDVAKEDRPNFRRLWAALEEHLQKTEGGVGNRKSLEAMEESMKQLRALGYL